MLTVIDEYTRECLAIRTERKHSQDTVLGPGTMRDLGSSTAAFAGIAAVRNGRAAFRLRCVSTGRICSCVGIDGRSWRLAWGCKRSVEPNGFSLYNRATSLAGTFRED